MSHQVYPGVSHGLHKKFRQGPSMPEQAVTSDCRMLSERELIDSLPVTSAVFDSRRSASNFCPGTSLSLADGTQMTA